MGLIITSIASNSVAELWVLFHPLGWLALAEGWGWGLGGWVVFGALISCIFSHANTPFVRGRE